MLILVNILANTIRQQKVVYICDEMITLITVSKSERNKFLSLHFKVFSYFLGEESELILEEAGK